MAQLNDLDDVQIDNPRVGDNLKYTADGWKNASPTSNTIATNACGDNPNNPCIDGSAIKLEDAGCPAIEVTDTVGQFAGYSAEICANRFEVFGGKNTLTSGELKARETDAQIELRADRSRLHFRDSEVTTPVTLSMLLGSQTSPTIPKVFDPIIRDYTIDEDNSNKTGTVQWKVKNLTTDSDEPDPNAADAFVFFSYGSDWASIGFDRDRALGVVKGPPMTIQMPPGANAAIVYYQSKTTFGVGTSDSLSANGSSRALHIAHRLSVEGAQFPITWGGNEKTGFGNAEKAIIAVLDNGPTAREDFQHTKSFNKMDVIEFANNARVTFTPRVDVLRGGRGGFSTYPGRIVLFPFWAPGGVDWEGRGDGSSIGSKLAGAGAFDTLSFSSEEDLLDLYDQISPREDAADDASLAGTEFRNLMSRIINALGSRKNNKPAVDPATDAEYDAQIAAAWALVDNTTLETITEFEAALSLYVDEVSKPKYGISFLFNFEAQAGMSTRGLL